MQSFGDYKKKDSVHSRMSVTPQRPACSLQLGISEDTVEFWSWRKKFNVADERDQITRLTAFGIAGAMWNASMAALKAILKLQGPELNYDLQTCKSIAVIKKQ